jgi:hypothetical protein
VDKKIIWLYVGDVIPSVVMREVDAFIKYTKDKWFTHDEPYSVYKFDYRVITVRKYYVDFRPVFGDNMKNMTVDRYHIDVEIRDLYIENYDKTELYYNEVLKTPTDLFLNEVNSQLRRIIAHHLRLILEGFNMGNAQNIIKNIQYDGVKSV